MSATANLGIVYLSQSQASKEVSINAGWDVIDAGVVIKSIANTITGSIKITRTIVATGNPAADLWLVAPADTGLTASTEAPDVTLDFSATRQFATGALTNQRAMRVRKPTYAFIGASTLATAATVAIEGAPIAGTNATITNPWALLLESGSLGAVAAPVATANYGTVSVGGGGFGGGAGNYAGSSSGSQIAVNAAAAFAGDLLNLQTNGVSEFRVTGDGKIGAFGVAPVGQQPNTTDLGDVVRNLGFLATGGATALNLNGGALNCGNLSVSGVVGGSGTAFTEKRFVLTFPSDADYTLGTGEKDAILIDVQTGVITTTRNIIVPGSAGGVYEVINRNAQSVVLKTSGGTGITIPSGRTRRISFPGGTNAFAMTPSQDYTV